MRALIDSAFAISTICCLPTVRFFDEIGRLEVVDAQLVQQALRFREQAAPQDLPEAAGELPVEEDVLGYRELLDQVELLVDDGDARPPRPPWCW